MSCRLSRVGKWEEVARKAGFQPVVMAALCAVSLRQMERFFALRFEQTPREWVSEFRCRVARELISQGWSNRAVALDLGFANESHFCHEFKRLCGVSPQSFAPGFVGNEVGRGGSGIHGREIPLSGAWTAQGRLRVEG